MRIVHTQIAPPKNGDYREVARLLILPKRIGNETRFLERAVWSEVYTEGSVEGDGLFWAPVAWKNE